MHPGVFAERWPEKAAYVMADGGEVVTYAELEARSNQGARLFRSRGLGAGDCVAVYMENNARYLEICWAAQRSGLYYTCIASHLTAPEVAYILRDSGAKMLVASYAKAGVAADILPSLPPGLARFMAGGTIEGYESWEHAAAAEATTRIADESEGHDFLYSSGTTGRPKGVRIPLSGAALGSDLAYHELVMEMMGKPGPDDTMFSPAPLYHAAPLRFCMAMQRCGAGCVLPARFDAEQSLRLIEAHRISHSLWVPTMFVRLLKLPEAVRGRYDVSSLKAAVHGAAPCPVPVKERMIDWFGPVLFEYYGATEGNGLCMIDSARWLERRGSVGRAILGEVHILGADGNDLPAGEAGDIYFARGYDFAYHNDPAKTAAARSAQGWTTLGDVGYLDRDGYLYLTDRKAFTIITGGVNVYPQEVENRLITHPAVIDAAVIGVPDEDLGEAVKAVVQPLEMAAAGPALAAELMAFCREVLSPVKCPRSVDFTAALPREANGKLYKRLLKDRYRGQGGSGIV